MWGVREAGRMGRARAWQCGACASLAMWGVAAFVMYSLLVTAAIVYLIWYVAPAHGNSSIFVYIGICSLIGSLSVMSVKVPARAAPCTPVASAGELALRVAARTPAYRRRCLLGQPDAAPCCSHAALMFTLMNAPAVASSKAPSLCAEC